MQIDRGAKLTTYVSPVPSLDTTRVVPLLSHMPSSRAQGKFCLCFSLGKS